MKNLVFIFSILLIQVVMSACGKQTNGYNPNAATAGNQVSFPGQWRQQGNYYYYGAQNYRVPNYSNWGGCTPFVQQPFYNTESANLTCMNIQTVQAYGQPAYIPNFNWGQGQSGVGPGQMCDPTNDASCGTLGVCQSIDSLHAFCRQNPALSQNSQPQQMSQSNQGPFAQQNQQNQQAPANGSQFNY